jgi:competence protein ComGC
MILEQTISNKHKNLDLVRKSNRNFKFVKMVVIMLITSVGLISTVPLLAYAQQQQQQTTNFVANLSGKDVQPTPVNTPATGTAKFQLNQNGTMSYEVDAKNLDKVIDASIDYKNTTEVVSLINPYATVSTGFNQVKSIYPTGPINGKLTDGVITSNKLMAGLEGKNVTDLANTMKGGSLNVVIRTQPHQDGEIAGQIGPSK